MPVSPIDRLLTILVLEGSWFLCVLQVADTPLLAGAAASTIATILVLGAAGLAFAWFVPGRAGLRRATTVCRVTGVVVFAGGLSACATSSGPAAGGVVLMGLGLILAVTGMNRSRRSGGAGSS